MPESVGHSSQRVLLDAAPWATVFDMPRRFVLFGATGYTGRITAEALTRAGMAPVLAGRSAEALQALVGDLAAIAPVDAAPSWQVADINDPASVRDLLTSSDDVLISTVGPFSLIGAPAVTAAVDAGCVYLDSTGEGAFIRRVFEEYGPRAEATGARLLTAFGYDFVPGNLAAAIALDRSEGLARRVEIGYFVRGGFGMSSGTKASMMAAVMQSSYEFTGGVLSTTKGKPGVATFDIGNDKTRDAVAVGATEQFSLPRIDPTLDDVSVYLGWSGSMSGAASAGIAAAATAAKVPGVGSTTLEMLTKKAQENTGEGPSAAERVQAISIIVARTIDGVGRELQSVRVEGPNGYDLTADLLSWGAAMSDRIEGAGAFGPVDAFGLPALIEGCALMGLREV